MATPVWVHGKQGTVSINGNLFNCLTINFEETTQLEDITYSVAGSATARVVLPGYRMGSGTLTFIYDTANQPTIAPFALQPTATVPPVSIPVIFYPDGTKPFATSMYTERLGFTTGPQAGAVKCTVSFQTTGPITEPTS
jgi:hypothetical protein